MELKDAFGGLRLGFRKGENPLHGSFRAPGWGSSSDPFTCGGLLLVLVLRGFNGGWCEGWMV